MPRHLTVGLTVLATASAACGTDVDVLDAVRTDPTTVELLVAACNPSVLDSDVERVAADRYEVVVSAEGASVGENCGSSVEIAVDGQLAALTVHDRTSGETYTANGSGEAAPFGLDGRWRMTTVANGEPVRIGINTAEIPEIEIDIDADADSGGGGGIISGDFGCNGASMRIELDAGSIIGLPDTLTTEEELCSVTGDDERMVLTERTLLELLSGVRTEVVLRGDDLEIATPETNAVFVRVAD